jgi:hypothetical protein
MRFFCRLAGSVARLVLGAGVVTLLIAPCFGQEPNRRLALVIGNNVYRTGGAPTGANDADLIAEALGRAGFDVSGKRNADLNTIRQQISEFLDKVSMAGPETSTFVYFGGYGLQYKYENYFVPSDAALTRPEDIRTQTLQISDFIRQLASTPAALKVVVLDAARRPPLVPAGISVANGLSPLAPEAGMLVVFNASPGSSAGIENGPHGVFAQELANAIGAGTFAVDELHELVGHVRLRVSEITNGAVVPWYASNITSPFLQFLFRVHSPVVPPVPQISSPVISPMPQVSNPGAPSLPQAIAGNPQGGAIGVLPGPGGDQEAISFDIRLLPNQIDLVNQATPLFRGPSFLTLAPIPIPRPTGSHRAISPNLGLGGEILPNPVFPRVPSFIFFPQSQLFVVAPSFLEVVPGIPGGLLAIRVGPLSLAPVQQTMINASTNAPTVVGARLGVASVMPPLPAGQATQMTARFPQPPPVVARIGLHPAGPGAVLPSYLATTPGPVHALPATVGSPGPSPAMAANISHLVLPSNPRPPGVAPAQSVARLPAASPQAFSRLAAPAPPQPPAPPPQIAVQAPPPPSGVSRPTSPVVNPTAPIMAPNRSTPLSSVHASRPF